MLLKALLNTLDAPSQMRQMRKKAGGVTLLKSPILSFLDVFLVLHEPTKA